MTASTQFKALLAGVATVALIGSAIAQGNPPNPAKSAPIGAGQQSSQGTPMGTTGTPGATTGAMPSGSTSGGTNMGSSSTTGSSAPMTSGSTSMGSGSTSADTSTTGTTRPMRTARADRN